jgi:hypothetical protein
VNGLTEIPAAVDRILEIAASQGFKATVDYVPGRAAGDVATWVRLIWVPADRWQDVPAAFRPRLRYRYPESVRDVLRLSHWLAVFGVDFTEL